MKKKRKISLIKTNPIIKRIGKMKSIILVNTFLIISQLISPQLKKEDLTVINFSKEYSQKETRLQDIADIEYILLETTDDILLSDKATLSCVSDKFILIHEFMRGDIFVFNRSGKVVSHFNHKGQSSREYSMIGEAGTIFDEKKEEIYVCSHSIQVYSLNGEYKRTLKKNTIQNVKVFNFDDESLLVYDDVNVDPVYKSTTNINPYYFISKVDGSTISVLDIQLPKRYSTRMVRMLDNKMFTIDQIYFPKSMYYGHDYVIADMSSDTLYMLTQNKELTPLLVRNPSVHSSEPRTIWTTLLTTDKFILIGKYTLNFNSKGGRIPVYMYEFETGEINGISIFDVEFNQRRWGPGSTPAMGKNLVAELIWPSSISEAYKKKQLKGDIEKIVTSIDEDDNPIVRIIKFK